MSTSEATDAQAWAVGPCMTEVTHEIGRLATEVSRMDPTDLGAPWKDDEPSRRSLVTSFIARLDPHSRIVKASDGRELSRAINHSWILRCDQLRHRGEQHARQELLRVLHDVRTLRIDLDAGVLAEDVDVARD